MDFSRYPYALILAYNSIQSAVSIYVNDNFDCKMKSIFRSPRFALLLTLTAALVVGYFIAPDYGLSWDEVGIYRYAKRGLNAYPFILHPQDAQADDPDPLLNLYGPAHFMFAAFLSRFVVAAHPTWTIATATHFIYFMMFLFGVLALYFLATRWMSEWAAFGVALLFISQPLFWGHAFTNPKDTPFMAFFIASVYLGLQMLDDDFFKHEGREGKNFARFAPFAFKIFTAGIVLGITTSIRSLGPMAGALAILFGLWKSPRKTISVAPLYFLIAGITTYLTWPYLWKAPVAHFIDSLQVMSQFPNTGETLFAGNLYPADQLPFVYFFTFISLQLTEPTLILVAVGVALSVWLFVKGKNREPLILFATWFLAPALYISSSGSTLYDNARQLLFLIPPLFILAGVGLDAMLERLKTFPLQAALLCALILPGVYACVQLHPYQYVYFNSLTGGVGGAFRKFDLDYSGTSFKEAMQYINANAAPKTQVVVIGGPRHTARDYARPDLKSKIIGSHDIDRNGVEYYYVLFLTRANADANRCLQAETVFTIERGGGVLAYVKKVKPKQECW